MSIIIRLQRLPWNANAVDIRQFFQNLTIPDGGVHIVGGENGDAFIAFGSDEDARQAMLMDGGVIKDAKIKLLLSSRTEMQKVIGLATQQALTSQNLMQTIPAATSFGTSNLSSILPNLLLNMSALSAPTIPANATDFNQDSKTVEINLLKEKGEDKRRSLSPSRSRPSSRSRSRSRSRDRRSRDRHRHRNRSRERKWRRDRSRSSRSRSRDRYKRRSRSRDRRSRDTSKDKDYYRSKDKRWSYDKKEKSPENKIPRTTSDSKIISNTDSNNFENRSGKADKPVSQSEIVEKLNYKIPLNSMSANKSPTLVPKVEKKEGVVKKENTESKTIKDSGMHWMNNVPMPPIISSWMLPQTNASVKIESDKKESCPTKPNAEKNVTNSPMPYGMFPPQFPFGPAYSASMYPFTGYPIPAADPNFMNNKQNISAMAAMPAMPIPPTFYNPYQSTAGLQTSQMHSTTSLSQSAVPTSDSSSVEKNPANKQPKLEMHNKTNVENDSPANFYSKHQEFKESKTYNSNYANDYKFKTEFNSYTSKGHEYSKRSYDDDNEYRNYSKRNFSDSRNNGWSDDKYEQNDDYNNDYSENRNTGCASYFPGSTCIEMSNLPLDASVQDLKKFFSPLPLYENSIKFQLDEKSNSSKIAFIKFVTVSHKFQALQYKGEFLKSNRVLIFNMDPTRWEKAEDITISQIDKEFLKVVFIPKRARKLDVLNAFSNTPCDLILMKDKGRDALIAYVKFSDKTHVKNALSEKNKILICGSRVKLEVITEEEFLIARADYEISCDDVIEECESQSSKSTTEVTSPVKFNKQESKWNSPSKTNESKKNVTEETKKAEKYDLKMHSDFNAKYNSKPDFEQDSYNDIEKSEKHEEKCTVKLKPKYNEKEPAHNHAEEPNLKLGSKDSLEREVKEDLKNSNNDQKHEITENSSNEPTKNLKPEINKGECEIRQNLKNTEYESKQNFTQEEQEEPICEMNRKSKIETKDESNSRPEKLKIDTKDVEEYEPQIQSFFNCILMSNLPPNISVFEIVEFFSEMEIVPNPVHIMYDENYKQTRTAYCEFKCEEDAKKALEKHESFLRHYIVSISLVSREEVYQAIECQPSNQTRSNTRPSSSLPTFKQLPPPLIRPRSSFTPYSRYPAPRSQLIPNRRSVPEHFGKPGCVIALENVPFKATIDDILEFCSQFNIKGENVIRRFSETGLPTGDVRICLRSPIEAQKALNCLDGRRILDRIIYISLV